MRAWSRSATPWPDLLREPGVADARDVPDVGAAATTQDRQVRETAAKRYIALGEIGRIAVVELVGSVELGVTAHRGVRTEPPDARAPVTVLGKRALEMGRVRAVDHVVERSAVGRRVDLLDGAAQRLAAREPAVGLDREGHDD